MSQKKRHDKHTQEEEEMAYQEEMRTEEPEAVTESKAGAQDQEVAGLQKEIAEWKDKYLRSMAEFENYRRRSIQEKADWIKLATQKLALDICDVLDNFERALQQADPGKGEDSFVKGVVMIEQQLRKVLEKEGITRIEALGEEFDPTLHEALAHIPSDIEENYVAAVIQNGYRIHDKILRPARVAVSSGKPDAPAAQADESELIEIKID
jgi:molecular chaperone GrpE